MDRDQQINKQSNSHRKTASESGGRSSSPFKKEYNLRSFFSSKDKNDYSVASFVARTGVVITSPTHSTRAQISHTQAIHGQHSTITQQSASTVLHQETPSRSSTIAHQETITYLGRNHTPPSTFIHHNSISLQESVNSRRSTHRPQSSHASYQHNVPPSDTTDLSGPHSKPETLKERRLARDKSLPGIPGIDRTMTKSDRLYIDIFTSNITRRSTGDIQLPAPGERFTSTAQLALCNRLLHMDENIKDQPSLTSAQRKWREDTLKDETEQQRVKYFTALVEEEFHKASIRDSKTIAEILLIAPMLDREHFRKLMNLFIKSFEDETILDIHLLQGIVQLVQCAPDDYLYEDDLVRILAVIRKQLEDTHLQSSKHPFQLALALSRVLDVMGDNKVKDLSRVTQREPLSDILNIVRDSKDPYLLYQASYAFQALQYVPDEESVLRAVLRHSGTILEGTVKVASVAKLDMGGLFDGLRSIGKTFAEAYEVTKNVIEGTRSLIQGGQGVLETLKELGKGQKRVWYCAIRTAEQLVQEGRLNDFKRLVLEAPCRQDPEFQWGISQLLGEIAANPIWNFDTRQDAARFLIHLLEGGKHWTKDNDVRLWMLTILECLRKLPERENPIRGEGREKLEEIILAGDDVAFEPYPLVDVLPEPDSSPLLDRAQHITNVEFSISRLKTRRTEGYNKALYILPDAKTKLLSDSKPFPLLQGVKSVLKKGNFVYLVLGDSGAGKSTFSRNLEINLWEKYKRGDKIPLYINLPTIDNPMQDLVAKQLREYGFNDEEIQELKSSRHFILICDGYDEGQYQSNLYSSNQFNATGDNWKVQMVISCRSTYLSREYRYQFEPTTTNRYETLTSASQNFQEAVIIPFSVHQIKEYIGKFVRDKNTQDLFQEEDVWSEEEYISKLNIIPNMMELVKNPFLLTLALRALPSVFKGNSDVSKVKATRLMLYDQFIDQWISVSRRRILDSNNSDMQTEFQRISIEEEGFTNAVITFCKSLAGRIFAQPDKNPIIQYNPRRDKGTWKEEFCGNSIRSRILRESSPLKGEGNQYQFIHKSLAEYFFSMGANDPQFDQNDQKDASQPNSPGNNCVEEPEEANQSNLEAKTENSHNETSFPVSSSSPVSTPISSSTPASTPISTPVINAHIATRPLSIHSEFHIETSAQRSGPHSLIRSSSSTPPPVNKRGPASLPSPVQSPVAARGPAAISDILSIGTAPQGPQALPSPTTVDSQEDTPQAPLQEMTPQAPIVTIPIPTRRPPAGRLADRPTPMRKSSIMKGNSHLSNRLLVGDLSIIQFMAERAQQDKAFKKQLLNIVMLSKTDSGSEVAAANAMTILVRSGERFNGSDLSGVRIRGADLSGGDFDSADFRKADLRDVILARAWLRHADFSGAQMNNVEFKELPYLALSAEVNACAYSHDGEILAVGFSGGLISLYLTSNWVRFRNLPGHSLTVTSLAFSPDSKQLASSSHDQLVKLWDVRTGNLIQDISGQNEAVSCVVYSPAGMNQIAAASNDSIVRIYDLATLEKVLELKGHLGIVKSVAFSPREDFIATASHDWTVRIWNPTTGRQLQSMRGHTAWVTSVAASVSTDIVASSGQDMTVRLWNIQMGTCLYILRGHTGFVKTVAFSPSGHQLASCGGDHTVRFWDGLTGAPGTIHSGHKMPIVTLAYSPDGKQIATGSWDSTVRLWDTNSHPLPNDTIFHTGSAECVGGPCAGLNRSISNPVLPNFDNSSPYATAMGINSSDHTFSFSFVACSPDGRLVATSNVNLIRLFDAEDGTSSMSLIGHGNSVSCLAFSPDSKSLVSGSYDKTARVWNLETGESKNVLSGHAEAITAVAYSPNGMHIITASEDRSIWIWSARTGKIFYHLVNRHSETIKCLAYSPDSNLAHLASGCGDGTVKLWRARECRFDKDLKGHRNEIESVAFSSNGRHVISGSRDNTARVWDTSTGDSILELKGHSSAVTAVAVSPNNLRVATGSWDSTVKIWDIESGKCLVTVTEFVGEISSIAWKQTLPEANGPMYFVTGCADKSVRMWKLIESEDGVHKVQLHWRLAFDGLMASSVKIQSVIGLSDNNRKLLEQRGAIGHDAWYS